MSCGKRFMRASPWTSPTSPVGDATDRAPSRHSRPRPKREFARSITRQAKEVCRVALPTVIGTTAMFYLPNHEAHLVLFSRPTCCIGPQNVFGVATVLCIGTTIRLNIFPVSSFPFRTKFR